MRQSKIKHMHAAMNKIEAKEIWTRNNKQCELQQQLWWGQLQKKRSPKSIHWCCHSQCLWCGCCSSNGCMFGQECMFTFHVFSQFQYLPFQYLSWSRNFKLHSQNDWHQWWSKTMSWLFCMESHPQAKITWAFVCLQISFIVWDNKQKQQ